MSIKFLVLGEGGILVFFLGGGSANFIFMGARIFLKEKMEKMEESHRISQGPG